MIAAIIEEKKSSAIILIIWKPLSSDCCDFWDRNVSHFSDHCHCDCYDCWRVVSKLWSLNFFFSNRSDHNNGNLALNRLMFVIIVLIVWYPIQEEKGQYSLTRVHVVFKTSHQEILHYFDYSCVEKLAKKCIHKDTYKRKLYFFDLTFFSSLWKWFC